MREHGATKRDQVRTLGTTGRSAPVHSTRNTRPLGSLALLGVAVLLLLLSPALLGSARAYTVGPSGAPVEPDPMLEGNVTVASHPAGYAALQYAPATGTPQNISASIDQRVKNPYQVTPTSILAPGILQGEKIAGTYWNTTGFWPGHGTILGGATETGPTVTTVNGQPAITFTLNTSAAHLNSVAIQSSLIIASNWPSPTNPAFDTYTIGATLTGPSCPVAGACYADLGIYNQTAWVGLSYNAANGGSQVVTAGVASARIAPGTGAYSSATFATLSQSAVAGFNASGSGATSNIAFSVGLWLPATATAATYTLTIVDVALTTSPLVLGNTIWGAKNTTMQRGTVFGADNLSSFSPPFSYTSVAGGGYTVAITQQATDLPGANVSLTEGPINIANATAGGPGYVEQVTYQFTFGLPVAPGLSYTTFKLVDKLGISGVQYVSASFGGSSYTSVYQALLPLKWTTVQSTTTATLGQAWLGIIDYTQAQWNSISTAPSFFSASGLAYYYWVAVGIVASALGLGAGAAARNASQLRTR